MELMGIPSAVIHETREWFAMWQRLSCKFKRQFPCRAVILLSPPHFQRRSSDCRANDQQLKCVSILCAMMYKSPRKSPRYIPT